jgi:cell division septal protein FtsQ
VAETSGGTGVATAEPAEPSTAAATRQQRSRRRLRRPSWRVLAAAAAGCGAAAGALLLTSLQSPLGVAEVVIEGAGPTLQPAVAAAVPDAVGQPFRSVDADAVVAQMRAIEGIDAASLEWSWWNTLTVVVQEQKPVAVVATPAGFRVLGAEGDPVRSTGQRPVGLPLLEVANPAGQEVGLQVAGQVPNALLPQTDTIVVSNEGRVELRLTSGSVADLGTTEDLAEKFAVLGQLLPVGAERYSVAVPERPALQGIPAPAEP